VTPEPLFQLEAQPHIDFQRHKNYQKPVKLRLHPENRRTVFTLEFQNEISECLIQNMNIPLQTKEIEDDFILKYGLTHR
jgi:hypothetical protein